MSLDFFPNPERTSLCLLTFDVNIHFYNLPADPNGEPTVLWVGDVDNPFVPFPKEKLMLNVVRDREKIDIFLDKLANFHHLENKKHMAATTVTGAALGAAINMLQLEGGRILVFSSTICSLGSGQVKVRDDPKLYNSSSELKILQPESQFYTHLAEELVKRRICVDLFFTLSPKHASIDLASFAPLPAITGGDLYYYNEFDITKHAEKLHYEIFRVLSRSSGTEVVLKARTSQGLSVVEYFGSFLQKEVVDFELSSIDADKTVSFVLRNDEKLKEGQNTYIQFAMLYTTAFGEKRIRIFNQMVPVCKNLNGYFKSGDVEAVAEFIVKREVSKVSLRGAKASREALMNNLVTMLYNYRHQCSS
eukprot:CAMPEP_0202963266 /NCGR_PEP_ID=MMETSP1396-20130829/7245_1 /ASSEMBLY_ACC=CAM_ASM_000872 /TAXON_ID= /ORGANISM="Pseudokeronopsis sp., Strain Brazil" /LENGTH=361 /DNA_ID=CAMNT_0049684321 /DNA_START=1043 /DNA_END=2128 /DNA_ORIENTATION=+